jgi:hypothetical protein
MKNVWKKYKEVFCKSVMALAVLIIFAGVGTSAYNRMVYSAETQTGQTVADSSENYQKAGATSTGALTAYIDWENQDLKLVSTLGDEYFYVSDAKMKSWDEIEAENGVAIFDLSWITKEYELNIKGDKNPSDIITINIKAPRNLKAKFSIANEEPKITLTVTETVNKKKVTTELSAASAGSVQWRKGTTGAWKSYSTLNLQSFLTKGTTLNLRLAGECNSDSANCYLPSKVASVKVTKKANAPSVKVDASKLTLGVKKGQEYVITTATTTTAIFRISDAANATPELKNVANGALGGDGYSTPLQGFNVKVRTGSTEKKAASKWNVISYPDQRTVSSSALTAKLDASGKLTLTNNTTYNIEYLVGETALVQTIDKAGISSKTKWSTVKAQKTTTSKASKTTTVTTASAIFFRYAQEKDNAKTTANEAQLASTIGIIHPAG